MLCLYKENYGEIKMFFNDSKIRPGMSLTQAMVYEGNAFRTFHLFDIPAQGNFNISVKNGPSAIHLFNRLVRANLPNVLYQVYAVPSGVVYGANINIFNMNAFNQKPSANLVRICTSVASPGQLTDLHALGGVSGVGNRLEGDESIEPDDIKILPANTEFLIRLVNPNTEIAKAFLYLKWFETPVDE